MGLRLNVFLRDLCASVVNFQSGFLSPQDNEVVITDITVYFREKEMQNQRHEVCLKYIGSNSGLRSNGHQYARTNGNTTPLEGWNTGILGCWSTGAM